MEIITHVHYVVYSLSATTDMGYILESSQEILNYFNLTEEAVTFSCVSGTKNN